MSSNLIAALHQEERSIVAELRASRLFQRLEGVRKLLSLYDAQPSVAGGFDAVIGAEPERAAAPLRMVPPQVQPAQQPSTQAIAMPGPVVGMAEAAPVDAVRPQVTAGDATGESASVVSSVRAALLGIGKS